MSFSEARYSALLDKIFVRFPSVQKAEFKDSYKPGLEGMQRFTAALGHPEADFRSIHIAGTNGKGSVASMLAAVLAAAGFKVGLYTSPHITDFRERAKIVKADGCSLVPKEYVFEFLSSWEPRLEEYDLSFFEITTGLAVKYFSDEKGDWAIIETGLGGRLDSTNVITPELTVITSIGLDHCQILGDTLADIAREKAGIFKPGVPAVIGESHPETAPVFEEEAWMVCPLTYADAKAPYLWYRHGEIAGKMDLHGEYEQKNLRTALAAVDILRNTYGITALSDADLVVTAIEKTAAMTAFRGRWEKLSDLPLVIADIGHNPPALAENFRQLKKLLSDGRISTAIIVYGVMKDKDLGSILPLMPPEATYVFVAPDGERALPAENILKAFKAHLASEGISSPRAYAAGTVRQGVQMAINLAQTYSEDTNRSASATKRAPVLIYIGGSTFVVGEAMRIFR